MVSFVYGIGAARSGTTWLARSLRGHAEAKMPPLKELHYFDSLQNGYTMFAMDQMIRVRSEVRQEVNEANGAEAREKLSRRVGEIDRWIGLIGSQTRNDKRYEALMRRNVNPAHKLVADITPSYATLNRPVLRRMAALNGGDTKFVMLLRDPLDRLWSNIRHSIKVRSGDPEALRSFIVNAIAEGGPSDEMDRGDYAATLTRLKNVVSEDQICVIFYEDLGSEKTLQKLSDFLELDARLQADENVVNASDGVKMKTSERSVLTRALTKQYEYVAAQFGRLPLRWQENMQEYAA